MDGWACGWVWQGHSRLSGGSGSHGYNIVVGGRARVGKAAGILERVTGQLVKVLGLHALCPGWVGGWVGGGVGLIGVGGS